MINFKTAFKTDNLLFSIHRMFRNGVEIVEFFMQLTFVNVDKRDPFPFFHLAHSHVMKKWPVGLDLSLCNISL